MVSLWRRLWWLVSRHLLLRTVSQHQALQPPAPAARRRTNVWYRPRSTFRGRLPSSTPSCLSPTSLNRSEKHLTTRIRRPLWLLSLKLQQKWFRFWLHSQSIFYSFCPNAGSIYRACQKLHVSGSAHAIISHDVCITIMLELFTRLHHQLNSASNTHFCNKICCS